ncbi:hypothetical protein LUZ62_070975 [Rhynchospora pubera]|uniref:Protein phosphatase n=1 Tax=Rhynchospora pubera TaxID=906938 RepID=A0AAV8CYH6_9POAL|nr:hypothetical protein LUZ62_070975 [Rhynchospora pubera]
MPSGYLTNQKGLQTSTELLLARGRSFFFGNTWFFISPKSPLSFTRVFHAADRRTPFPFVEALGRTPFVRGSEPEERLCSSVLQRGLMSACNHIFGQPQLNGRKLQGSVKQGIAMPVTARSHVCYGYKGMDYCKSGNLRNREPWGYNMVYRSFWNDAFSNSFKSNSPNEPGVQDFKAPCSTAPYSSGAAPEVSYDGAPRDEQSGVSGAPSDIPPVDARPLKLLSGSCYLPHPDKEETGGEDAHFICVDRHAVGVADGVGGWADLGIDAGQYARELMSHSESAIKEEPKGSVDPSRVLEKAYTSTKARGSSTACIIALTDQGVHAVNLGDSGFIVVREGCTIFRSPVQQHDFNFTYQLESGNGSDLPSSAQVFNFPVASGDVIIAGTDGLFDNLYTNEVTAVVVHAIRAGFGPQITAQKIAALARQRALDKNRQTPFSTAAQDAGYRYYGGKLDDITVVVSYITASD